MPDSLESKSRESELVLEQPLVIALMLLAIHSLNLEPTQLAILQEVLVLLRVHLEIINAGLDTLQQVETSNLMVLIWLQLLVMVETSKADVMIQNGVADCCNCWNILDLDIKLVTYLQSLLRLDNNSVGRNARLSVVSIAVLKNSFSITFKAILLLDLQIRFSLSILLVLLQTSTTLSEEMYKSLPLTL